MSRSFLRLISGSLTVVALLAAFSRPASATVVGDERETRAPEDLRIPGDEPKLAGYVMEATVEFRLSGCWGTLDTKQKRFVTHTYNSRTRKWVLRPEWTAEVQRVRASMDNGVGHTSVRVVEWRPVGINRPPAFLRD